MKLFGVNIAFDEKETKETKEAYQKESGLSSKELGMVRVYEITDEYDKFRKYRIARSRLDIIRIHIQKVIDYWLFRRLRYFVNSCNQTRQETFRPPRRKE